MTEKNFQGRVSFDISNYSLFLLVQKQYSLSDLIMKKKFPIVAITLLLFLSACIVSKEKLAGVEKVAFVSVMLKKEIDMSEFNSVAGMMSQVLQDEEFDLEPITNRTKDKVKDELAKEMPFQLLPEEQVINKDGYKEIVQEQGAFMKVSKYSYEIPTGYVPLNSLSKKGRLAALAAFPEAQGVMYVRLSYRLNKISSIGGFGVAEIAATMDVAVYNRANKKALYVQKRGRSEDRIKFALGGAFDAKKITSMCEEATEDAYQKVSAYVNKKMAK